ncbi:T9SS type A sorting domain-containing protein [Chryseobacterium sp. LC2016-29]|uniref:T9SS type A sorting domain-containing protein n=1 Tax=Chryseobacterium sp. LC2016-29 TaxID=2897331 RepID=UPI001E415CE9|nr:T9SS type A sorting domain-containing protein [Chryseobacterium sp. LC2016-29]MCD0478084.1 T9SS type A sorting domain-containing protein [Chryseobacterium sp. LC2016-29]
MKKVLFSMLVGVSQLAFSQQLISFEESEGYTTANIDTQQGWRTTAIGVGSPNVLSQTVSTEQFVGGSRSLKITKEAVLPVQNNPVVGAFKPIGSSLAYNNFTISFDIRITEKASAASLYEFQTIGNGPAGRVYVIRLRFNKTGGIVAAQTTGTSSTFATTTGTWNADTWYRVKIVGTATGLTYYLNDTQIYTGNFFLNYNFDEMAFVHDNNSGSGYIDRIAINNEGGVLSTKDDVKIIKNMLSIYPNPTSDILNIKTDSKINTVSVIDITGKKVNVKLEDNKIDVRSLTAGIYLINIETKEGISTEKFIKK